MMIFEEARPNIVPFIEHWDMRPGGQLAAL
jgi:hypothetical protein